MQTRGQIFLHELLHVDLFTQRHIDDQKNKDGIRVYGAEECAAYAQTDPGTAILNADSYGQFAQGLYYKDHFGVLPPPRKDRKDSGAVLTCASATQEGANKYTTRDNMKNSVDTFCSKLVDSYSRGINGRSQTDYLTDTPEGMTLTAST